MKQVFSRWPMARLGLQAARAAALALPFVLAGCNSGGEVVSFGPVQLRTLSNRADLISNGDAMVEVTMPSGSSNLKVTLNGTDVTSAFAKRADGRTTGLVTGLSVGNNT